MKTATTWTPDETWTPETLLARIGECDRLYAWWTAKGKGQAAARYLDEAAYLASYLVRLHAVRPRTRRALPGARRRASA